MSVKNLSKSSLTVPDFPIGGLMMWGVVNGGAPRGWLRCDGASYNTVDYPELFAVLGYTFGGSGASFNVPNQIQSSDGVTLIGMGTGTGLTARTLGTTVGLNTHTLTANESAQFTAHTHTGSANTAHTHSSISRYTSTGGGTFGTGGTSVTRYLGVSPGALSSVGFVTTGLTVTIDSHSANAFQSHENKQPSLGVEYLVKAY
jgi:microcystin-dependent protein